MGTPSPKRAKAARSTARKPRSAAKPASRKADPPAAAPPAQEHPNAIVATHHRVIDKATWPALQLVSGSAAPKIFLELTYRTGNKRERGVRLVKQIGDRLEVTSDVHGKYVMATVGARTTPFTATLAELRRQIEEAAMIGENARCQLALWEAVLVDSGVKNLRLGIGQSIVSLGGLLKGQLDCSIAYHLRPTIKTRKDLMAILARFWEVLLSAAHLYAQHEWDRILITYDCLYGDLYGWLLKPEGRPLPAKVVMRIGEEKHHKKMMGERSWEPTSPCWQALREAADTDETRQSLRALRKKRPFKLLAVSYNSQYEPDQYFDLGIK